MRHILVGAGAVGVAYGWYLAKGGDAVAYLVKPKHAEELRAGVNVYFPRKRGVREPLRFEARPAGAAAEGGPGYEVLTDSGEVARWGCDVAWLCISATALRGPWLEPFLASLGPRTTLVMLTPGAEDRAYLAARFPAERLVGGLISLVAWQTPLPDEAPHPPGVAIWFPPLTKLPFHGPRERARAVVEALNRGEPGVAKHIGEVIPDGGPVAGGVLTTHVAALEGAGWTFAALRKSPLKQLAAQAAREAMAVMAAHQGRRAPFMRQLVRPWTVLPAIRLAAWRMPYDFEVYLRYHFTKVRDQTAFNLAELVRIGTDKGLSVRHIEALREAVFGAR